MAWRDYVQGTLLCLFVLIGGGAALAWDWWRRWKRTAFDKTGATAICTVSMDTGRVLYIPDDPMFQATEIMPPFDPPPVQP